LAPGSVGLDIGCGNGKYLTVNPDVFIVGSDRSPSLVKFASSHQPHAAVVSDILELPHQNHNFDFAISIAVLHHLSTPERRVEAVQTILDTLNVNGRALLYVWALEQKDSRRGWDEGNQQDTMVPWVMREKKEKQKKDRKQQNKGDAAQQAQPEQTTGTQTTGTRHFTATITSIAKENWSTTSSWLVAQSWKLAMTGTIGGLFARENRLDKDFYRLKNL
jgi:tRNA (uracil-5-)-methyltransferase TRM9